MEDQVRLNASRPTSNPPQTKSRSLPNADSHKQLEVGSATIARRASEARSYYGRGRQISTRRVKDKKLRGNLQALERKYKDTTFKARDAEILQDNNPGLLEPETPLEKTYRVRQDDIRKDLPIQTAKKGFELKLDGLGPYVAEYTRNGKDLLLAGRKGHVATMDWRDGKLGCELQLGETVRDAKWLHNSGSVSKFPDSHRLYLSVLIASSLLWRRKNSLTSTIVKELRYIGFPSSLRLRTWNFSHITSSWQQLEILGT